MILFLISIILFVLKQFGVINLADWIVALPAMIGASTAYWLLMKSEFEYFKSLKNKPEEQEECEQEA